MKFILEPQIQVNGTNGQHLEILHGKKKTMASMDPRIREPKNSQQHSNGKCYGSMGNNSSNWEGFLSSLTAKYRGYLVRGLREMEQVSPSTN